MAKAITRVSMALQGTHLDLMYQFSPGAAEC